MACYIDGSHAALPHCRACHLDDHARLAKTHFANEDFRKAVAEMNQYIAKLIVRQRVWPSKSDIHMLAQAYSDRAAMHYRSGKYAEAISDLTEVIDRSTDYPASHTRGQRALMFRGYCYQAMGNPGAATNDFARATRMDN